MIVLVYDDLVSSREAYSDLVNVCCSISRSMPDRCENSKHSTSLHIVCLEVLTAQWRSERLPSTNPTV
jgi:hypothetical protein